jgi:thioredoxin 1
MITLTKSNFLSTLQTSSLPVLVLFGTPWCGPCKTLKPIVEQVSSELSDKLAVAYVDAEEDTELAQSQKLTCFPTLIVYNKGIESSRALGLISKSKVLSLVS